MKKHWIKVTDGSTIAATEHNRKGKKSILLVHGWPLNQKMFDYMLQPLLDEDMHIVTFDLRGFGDSDCVYFDNLYSRMADDLMHIVKHFQLRDFTLLGFSMGGAIATEYVTRYENNGMEKMILLDAAVPSYCTTENNKYGQTIESTNEFIELGYKDRPKLNDEFGDLFFYNNGDNHSPDFLNWFHNMSNSCSQLGEMKALEALRDNDLFDKLKLIDVPTLIIHGVNDSICQIGMADIMNEQIEDSALIEIEEAGHGALFDKMAEVNNAIVEFVR